MCDFCVLSFRRQRTCCWWAQVHKQKKANKSHLIRFYLIFGWVFGYYYFFTFVKSISFESDLESHRLTLYLYACVRERAYVYLIFFISFVFLSHSSSQEIDRKSLKNTSICQAYRRKSSSPIKLAVCAFFRSAEEMRRKLYNIVCNTHKQPCQLFFLSSS